MDAFYQSKNVLVTGAFGFIGSHIATGLAVHGANVTCLDLDVRPDKPSLLNERLPELVDRLTPVEGDICDAAFLYGLVDRGKFDIVFHFAAYATVIEKAVANPIETIHTNTMGTANLLEALRRASRRPTAFFFASTDKVYGELQGDEANNEERTPLRGLGVYDGAKLAADVFVQMYYEVFELPTIVLRLCNLFGPYDFNTAYRVIPKAMASIYGTGSPQPPELYLESVNHWRDYVYVDDAVQAILLLTANPACHGQVYNMIPCASVSTPALLAMVVRLASEIDQDSLDPLSNPVRAEAIIKNNLRVTVPAEATRVVAITKQHMSGQKLMDAIRFVPSVDLEEGLKRTIRFYRKYYARERGEQPT